MTEQEDTKFEPRDDEVFMSWEDKSGNILEHVDINVALAKLLVDEIIFLNSRVYVELDYKSKAKKDSSNYEWHKEKYYDEKDYKTTVLFVICNDVWVWGCADLEPITTSEIPELYRFHSSNSKWGSLKWACKKRNRQPQAPIVRDMKKDGVWCELMESLSPN